MALQDNLDAYVDPAHFGEAITVDGNAVNAVVDIEYETDLEVEGSTVLITVKDSDIAGAQKGTPAVVRGTNYKIQNIRPDGTGLSEVDLVKAL